MHPAKKRKLAKASEGANKKAKHSDYREELLSIALRACKEERAKRLAEVNTSGRKEKKIKMDQRVNYEEVKAWIAAQEAFEAATDQPAPLTTAQRKALEVLRLPAIPSSAAASAPSGLGFSPDYDYISLLHRFRDARAGVSIEFLEGGVEQRWTCLVNFLDPVGVWDLTFPVPGPKGEAGEVPEGAPVFARKKDAKQHAARTCVHWLIKNGLILVNGASVVFPKPKVVPPPKAKPAAQPLPLHSRVKSEPVDVAAGRSLLANIPLKAPPLAESSTSSSSAPMPPLSRPALPQAHASQKGVSLTSGGRLDVDDDDEIPAAQRVIGLCKRLNLPTPRYEIEADSDLLWSGYVDLGTAHDMLPVDLGRVHGVYGKKNAKEEIAMQLLGFLRDEEKRRAAIWEEMRTPL